MKHLVIAAHPVGDSFTMALTRAYVTEGYVHIPILPVPNASHTLPQSTSPETQMAVHIRISLEQESPASKHSSAAPAQSVPWFGGRRRASMRLRELAYVLAM